MAFPFFGKKKKQTEELVSEEIVGLPEQWEDSLNEEQEEQILIPQGIDENSNEENISAPLFTKSDITGSLDNYFEHAEVEEIEKINEQLAAEEKSIVEKAEKKKLGLFAKIKDGLKKTKDNFIGKIESVLFSFTKIDEDFFEELYEALILSDIGVKSADDILDKLRIEVRLNGTKNPSEVKELLKKIISEMLQGDHGLKLYSEPEKKPAIVLVIGVNGAGKTTTIGKLANNLVSEGKKVLVVAADTFRAAAIEQLAVWAVRAGANILRRAEGADPASVVYDALDAANKYDVLLIDTAGRLQNKKDLMEELKKISRIITKKLPDSNIETLLVLDATTGQNAVSQAQLFGETADITGIVLTKLDGTAKGGIIIPIKYELGIPVKLVGVGEKIGDLQPFYSEAFAQALFE